MEIGSPKVVRVRAPLVVTGPSSLDYKFSRQKICIACLIEAARKGNAFIIREWQ